jgi:hypothetical protein
MSLLLFSAAVLGIYVGREAVGLEDGLCPWLTATSTNNLQCQDDTFCLPSEETVGWSCCNDHGGRKKCPKSYTMCATPNRCAGETDFCCQSECSDHGGDRICPATTGVTKVKNQQALGRFDEWLRVLKAFAESQHGSGGWGEEGALWSHSTTRQLVHLVGKQAGKPVRDTGGFSLFQHLVDGQLKLVPAYREASKSGVCAEFYQPMNSDSYTKEECLTAYKQQDKYFHGAYFDQDYTGSMYGSTKNGFDVVAEVTKEEQETRIGLHETSWGHPELYPNGCYVDYQPAATNAHPNPDSKPFFNTFASDWAEDGAETMRFRPLCAYTGPAKEKLTRRASDLARRLA